MFSVTHYDENKLFDREITENLDTETCKMVPQHQRRRRRRAALPRIPERRVIVARGAGGFGFTIAGQRPCVVSAVATGGPAERAGLRAGDALLAVDGANVARASHASVARLVAAAPGAIALSVAPRESPPTDTEDTEPDERARTRRRHPPPRRKPQPLLHHPGCQASTSGVNEILQNLSRAQLTPSHTSQASLECRAVVGYLGTIETPQAAANTPPGNVRSAVRKLRQERRPATPILLSVLPNVLLLRRPTGQVLAQYHRERIVYAGSGSEADRRYFGLVTSAEMAEEASYSCHVFAVDPRTAEHEAHSERAIEFQIACTRDPVAERCLEFPPSAEYVVGVIRGMYSLPAEDCVSPMLQISKLAIKGDSPALGNFARCNRPVFRVPRDRRRHDEEFVANSPQPSNHSEITTTSSNSDSGIGFHNDCRNIADRILVVDFAGQRQPLNRFRQEMPRRPMGLVGCSSFEADGSFLSNTTPVVDGFGGQGRPLNLDDVILNANDLQPARHVSPRNEEDNYNYNVYGNLPSTSRNYNGVYDPVYTENEGHLYELLPQLDLAMDRVTETFNSVEMYEERSRPGEGYSASVENVTVISGGTSKASMDSVSVYSSRSHEEARPPVRKHLQASLDDMLMLGQRDKQPAHNDDDNFVHPASVKRKVRKSMKPLQVLSKTRDILTGKDRGKKEERRRALSASAGDVTAEGEGEGPGPLATAASEPNLRDAQSEQSSPFRRWTTGSGAGNSYRHTDHRALFNKQQMSESSTPEASSSGGSPRGQWPNGGVARWSLGLEQLLADPVGAAAFEAFLDKEFAHENIAFWYSCEAYNNIHDPEQRASLSKEIWERHLADGASESVNIDAIARRATMARMAQEPPPADLFQQGYPLESIVVIRCPCAKDCSPFQPECARADLRGAPAPYGPSSPDGSIMSNQERTPVASTSKLSHIHAFGPARQLRAAEYAEAKRQEQKRKELEDIKVEAERMKQQANAEELKKSASTASERRRSGGASLLPWRMRGPSRDRAAALPPAPAAAAAMVPFAAATDASAATTAESQLITDVVKSGALCRVVFPSGATSVVGVDAAVSVRQLVDRLLQRRNLVTLNYDVLLKDTHDGESSVVDANSPSSILGGREVIVERRCVVRMEVSGKCVAVRCRPARRLCHVLRPVLARYAAATAARSVLRDGAPVHPNTLMQELDGARLEIIELGEGSEGARDDDADSLSDLAVRLQNDYREEDQGGNSRGCRMDGAGSSGSGRVRAALKAGPPVHHHPPDFLENLRETQRRFQSKGEPSPAPRTPPPLPPKPSARPPTLV